MSLHSAPFMDANTFAASIIPNQWQAFEGLDRVQGWESGAGGDPALHQKSVLH
jgi:hypothetical protein